MRRYVLMTVMALAIALGGFAITPPQDAGSLNVFIAKMKSDCSSIRFGVTLVYQRDDDGFQKDWFLVQVYDQVGGGRYAEFVQGIEEGESPFFWVSPRVEGAPLKSKYRIEIYDLDGDGNILGLIDRVYYDCVTGDSWRDEDPDFWTDETKDQNITCYTTHGIYTTNTASEDGNVMVMWSYSKDEGAEKFLVESIFVEQGKGLDEVYVDPPCNVYIWLYFQPLSDNRLYYMPSQYWPHDHYGTGEIFDVGVNPMYNTFFPFDGPVRTPTPFP
ncbi:MAG: hypothetical protein GYB68_11050 [Chloroflexi bacterium]|nr:hypothetical protein [Chloroflexota bacterium]